MRIWYYSHHLLYVILKKYLYPLIVLLNSIDIIHAGRESYYLTLGKEDYYTQGPDPKGVGGVQK